jgi:hypothetical protein
MNIKTSMSLVAKVRRLTGAVRHHYGHVSSTGIVPGERLPIPTSVEIIEVQGGFLLIQYDKDGNGITDSWQATLEDAKEQAKLEYEIRDDDWTVKPNF